MGKIFKKWGKNNKGMTFVEILCAVAIMSLVSGIIGSVIVVSTRTYGKGISETNVQQEAQLAANNIGNIVKDAYKVVYKDYEDDTYYEDGEDTGEQFDGDYTELTLVTGIDSEYSVFYVPDKNSLTYVKWKLSNDADPDEEASGLLAENITKFKADTTDFADTRTITLDITVYDSSTDREIEMTYTMTSRNEAGTGIEYVAVEVPVQIYIDDVIMVPGETYQISISLYGEASGAPYVKSGTGDGLSADIVQDEAGDYYVEVTLGTEAKDKEGSSYTLAVAVKKSDGLTEEAASCTVYVRHVTGVSVSVSTNTAGTTGGMLEEAGAKYIFSSTVSGENLSKGVGRDYDTYYKNPQAVTWSWELMLDGTTYLSGSTDNHAATDKYISLESYTEDAAAPQIVFVAQQAMTSNFKLIVTATSSHADGYNKASHKDGYNKEGSDYDDVSGSAELTPRETKVTGSTEIILEPNEEGKVELGMKGGLTSEVSFAFKGCSESDTEDNTYYDDGYVYITPDRDEVGGEDDCDPYTFIVYATVGTGENQTMTITVHVSRIDEISIDKNKKSTTSSGITYSFVGKINPSSTTKYLVDNSLDDTQRSNTLATRITCEMLDGDDVVQKYQAICLAGIDGDGIVYIISSETTEEDSFSVKAIKPARINQNNDVSSIAQAPEIDVLVSANTDTGVKDGYTLQVTMEMLHPLGTVSGTAYTKSGSEYGEAWATVQIEGKMMLEVPEDIIVVEPGQGTDVASQSDDEMVVPITVNGGGVYSMSVKISGNSDSDTRISAYPDANDSCGNINPYMSSSATSTSGGIWYLGLVIGKDEEGTDGTDGLITVTVTAKDDSGDEVYTPLTFYLGVRRVNKVDIEVEEVNDKEVDSESVSASDWNVAKTEVMLAAYPTGVDGVNYYAEQEGCRWETSYKTPYAMEWRMEYDGDERSLSKWTDYFSSVSTSEDEDDYRSTVTFTLKKALPSGAVIKAYSLHAYGSYANLGDSIGDKTLISTTKYNKSGKEYDEVWGELKIADSLITVSSGWKRGGTVKVSYNIPDEYLHTEYDDEGNITEQYLTYADGTRYPYAYNYIATELDFYTKYISYPTKTNLLNGPNYFTTAGLGGERGLTQMSSTTNVITEYYATLYAWGEDNLKKTSFSSPYTDGTTSMWLDLDTIYIGTKVGVADYNSDYPEPLIFGEETFEVADVVFQYTNALPATSTLDGDDDGEWTNKKGDNTLVVYVTPDDTIDSYTSYYKLSEGWEETYEEYTLLTDRYVGVISDVEGTENDERLWDFEVTNTTGTEDDAGRSYVSFTFSNPKDYVGKVVQMIYEYNPYLCNTNHWSYSYFDEDEIEEIDGCEGILEFHFVNANINGSGTLPEVRYCPTFEKNEANGATSKTLADGSTVNYYYISDKSRFEIVETVDSAEGLARYQTTTDASTGIWTIVGNMTYSNNNWTYSAVNN